MTSKTVRCLTIFTTIVFCVTTTVWGLSQMSWPALSFFAEYKFLRPLLLIAFSGAGLVALSFVLKVNQLLAAALASFAIAILTGTMWPLIVTLWFSFASYVLGKSLLSVMKINTERVPSVIAAVIGAGIYGTAVGLAAHFPINYPGLYGFALAAPIIWGWRDLCAALRTLQRICANDFISKWHDLVIALIALVYFLVALMPEVGHDALAMHLFIPAHLATRHEWGFDVNTYVWAVMPMMGDWLFSIGYMLAGETAARLINVGFIFALTWLVRDLVLWAGGSALGAKWAAALFLSTPLTFTEGSSLFIESVWATFIVAGSISIFKLLQKNQQIEEQSLQLKLAGALLGAAAAAKAVTFTILPVLLLLLVLRYRVWAQRKLWSAVGLGLVLFLIIGIIPYANAWYVTGNPVFPFFNQIFKSPFYPPVNFDAAGSFGKGITWDVFYQATFYSEKFMESKPGSPGFQWMLLFLPALFILLLSGQIRGVILFVVAGVSIVLTFQSVTYFRYIFPSFAWIAAGIGVAFSTTQLGTVFTKKVLSIVGWAAVFLNLMFFKSGTHNGDLSLSPLMSQSGRETYLNNRLPIRKAIEQVNQINLGGNPVAIFSSPLTAGLSSDALYPNWYNYQFQTKVAAAMTPDDIAQLLSDKGVIYIILDNNWDTVDKRKMVENATAVISEQGTITVRKLKSSYQFQKELVENPDFSSHDGWMISPGLQNQSFGKIMVSVSSPAAQLVSVVAGRHYRNSVSAFCGDKPTQGRIQVNWLDSKSKFIAANIQVFDCTLTESTLVMQVTAPRGASKAAIYASGHTSIPLIISEVSFKQ